MQRLIGLVFSLAVIVNKACSYDLILNECECEQGENCTATPSNTSIEAWTTIHYYDDYSMLVSLQTGQISCSPRDVSHKILISLADQDHEFGFHGELYETGTDSRVNVSFNDAGVLLLTRLSFQPVFEDFSKESYCVRRINESYSMLEICCGGIHNSCIRKCCPYEHVFTNNSSSPCISSNTLGWELPKLTPKNGIYHTGQDMNNITSMKIHTGFPNCQIMPYNLTDVLFNFRMLEDGSLEILAGEGSGSSLKWEKVPKNAGYCIDSLFQPVDESKLKCSGSRNEVLVLCREQYGSSDAPKDWTYRMIYISGFGFAIFFLLVTATVHIILWEKQNIHAMTILCYVLTLTGFYICLLLIHIDETRKRFSNLYKTFIPEEFCPTLGIITHFMGVFSFAWLSVINFDLWWTFRVLKPMNLRSFDLKRLLCYAGFAFAVPTAVVSTALALQFSYTKQSESCPKEEEDRTIYPRYGEDSCFLTNSARPYYFYLPVGFLLLANLIFYLCTSCQMLRIYNATRRISSESTAKKQKQSCKLFLKLFLVMGITWISQVILSLVESGEHTWYSPIFTVLDLVNMFQAIAIFVIFVCKRETLRALEQKSPCLKSILYPIHGYLPPPSLGRSTDGSYKMSRTELTKHNSIESSSGSDHYRNHRRDRDSELISFS